MADPRIAPRARTVLVIDEGTSNRTAWVTQLRHVFSVVTAETLAGATVAIDGQEIAAIVLVLSQVENRVRTLVTALRRHRSLERVSVFVVSQEVSLLSAELVGLLDVEVIDPAQAEYDLSLQVGAAASRMSSRPAPRRLSSMPQMPSDFRALAPAIVSGSQRPLTRFTQDCPERGQRGLALCQRLSARDTALQERQRAAEDLKGLLLFIRADALALQQPELAYVLGLAEQVVARLNTRKGQVVVPRGVVGLLSSVVELGGGLEQLLKFDAELHRIRLESAIER